MKNQKFKIGDKVKYTKEFMFGKSEVVISKVLFLNGNKMLLENGDEFYNI